MWKASNDEAGIAAKIDQVTALGSIVRLEVTRRNDREKTPVKVEISKEQFRELQLAKNDAVFIKPKCLNLFPAKKEKVAISERLF